MQRSAPLALLALLFTVAPAAAKDVCVAEGASEDSGQFLVFNKVKRLTKPGTAITLQGTYIAFGASCPVSGAATVLADGSVRFGATAHCLLTTGFNVNLQFAAHGSADDFLGPSHTDRNGDGVLDTSDFWWPIDCASVTVP